MLSKVFITEFKWIVLALALSFILAGSINGSSGFGSFGNVPTTFLGLNLFLEILVFFVFSTFVVFGIKGFFEKYSQKFANVVIFITGVMLTVVIFILSYQILFQV